MMRCQVEPGITKRMVYMNGQNQPIILVVDDIPTNVVLIQALLKGKNYEVIPALSGVQALKIASERKPDVVILDIMMPEMDGYEVLARIRSDENLKDVKVLMVSALSKASDIKNAMDLGADDYITKPIVAKKLFDILDKLTK